MAGSPASPAELVGSVPMSVKVAPPSLDCPKPVNLLLLTLDSESLKPTTTLAPTSTSVVSLCVSFEPVSEAGLLTSTLVNDGTERSSSTSRCGLTNRGRCEVLRRGGWSGRVCGAGRKEHLRIQDMGT